MDLVRQDCTRFHHRVENSLVWNVVWSRIVDDFVGQGIGDGHCWVLVHKQGRVRYNIAEDWRCQICQY